MSDVVIQVEHLSKLYRIGRAQQRHDTLRDAIVDFGSRIADRIRSIRNPSDPQSAIRDSQSDEYIWALKDVSFEVRRGEVLGIIGRNGAGKSTLLKILSRITEPTEGRAIVRGRVGSLLEVGTGFHPELTGRENIYLNGAILGMKKAEIDRKFDEIVAFAEIEKFLDTPVKRYSSGMYVRLAFAVAAHLEPEILLVDEVLAVGDAAFQKKCLGKMGQVAGEGRTVLFVSHNMSAVTKLCGNSVLLEHGQIAHCGASYEVVTHYLSRGEVGRTRVDLKDYLPRTGRGDVRVSWIELRDGEGTPACRFTIGETMMIMFGLEVTAPSPNKSIVVSVSARTADGVRVFDMVNIDRVFPVIANRKFLTLALRVPDVRFYPGTYYLSIWIADRFAQIEFDHVQDVLGFEMVDGGRLTVRAMPRNALFFLTPEWMVLDGMSQNIEHLGPEMEPERA